MACPPPKVIYLILAGAAVLLVMRVVGRKIYPFALMSDSYYHLICAEEIRTNGLKIPRYIHGFLIKTRYTYPPLYHILLALFSERSRFWFERYSSVFFDLVQAALVWFVGREIFVHLGNTPFSAGIQSAVVTGAYLASPMLNAYITGPRTMNGTARTLGEALFIMAVCSTLLWELGKGDFFAILALFCFGLVPLSSKFGTQTLAALLVVMGLSLNVKWVVLILAGVFIGFIVSKGHLWKVIKGHYNHSRFYFGFLRKHYFGLMKSYEIKEYLKRFKYALTSYSTLKRFPMWPFEEKHFLHVLLFFNFFVWLAFLYWIMSLIHLQGKLVEPVHKTLFILALAPIFPLIFTSLPRFRSWGENFRYLEYYQWIYWLLLFIIRPKVFTISALVAILFSFFLLTIYFGQLRLWHQGYQKSEPFFGEIRRRYSGKKAHALSGNYYEMVFRGRIKIFLWSGNMFSRAVPYSTLEVIFGRFPYPKKNAAYLELLKKYGVELVCCLEQSIAMLEPEVFKGLEKVKVPKCQYMIFRLSKRSQQG